MSDIDNPDSINERAYEIVKDCLNNPCEQNLQALDEFSRTSKCHFTAIKAAKVLLQTEGNLRNTRLNILQKIRLQLELYLTRAQERQFFAEFATISTIAVAVFFWFYVQVNQKPINGIDSEIVREQPKTSEEFITGKGQQKNVVLEDGSILWLDWHSYVKVELDHNTRRVELISGAAMFKVVNNQNKPFIVLADGVETLVTGTEFSVDKRVNNKVKVAVLEGSVSVSNRSNLYIKLEAEEMVTADKQTIAEVQTTSSNEITAWRDGLIVFREKPLLEALQILEPYTSFVFDTSWLNVEKEVVSGTFFIERGDAALKTLFETYNLEGEITSHNTLRIKRSFHHF
ncbi:MAG: FecR domain-containing protein [Pseudomonadota bacterium]